MEIIFKNQHIFFALQSIWPSLDYRFKYHINQLVSDNSDEDFQQTVTVDDTTLIQIFESVSSQKEGEAKLINQEMLDALQPQLLALANMEAVQADGEEPNEAAKALLGIDEINKRNANNKAAKIANGKIEILS